MTGAGDLVVVAEGSTRLCVRDPADPAHVLKIELSPRARTRAGWRERMRRWLGREVRYFGDNASELRAWRRLQRRLGADALAGRFAACRGIVDTARGPALQCECVRRQDGTPAPSLFTLLFDDASPLKRLPGAARASEAARLCSAVGEFTAWLKANDIPLFDLNAGNFVVLPGPRLVCVDAKSVVSGKEIVPVSRWSRRLMHRKIDRRGARLAARIREALAPLP